MQIVPKPEVKKRPKFANKLSVVMIMLDSTSNAQFTRMMPQTEQYLKANTKTIIFKGQYARSRRSDKRFLSECLFYGRAWMCINVLRISASNNFKMFAFKTFF